MGGQPSTYWPVGPSPRPFQRSNPLCLLSVRTSDRTVTADLANADANNGLG